MTSDDAGVGQVAIELISEHVKRQLAQRAACLREKIARSQTILRKPPLLSPLPSPEDREVLFGSNVILMEQTTQLQGIYTILRNKASMRVDFIFYADRLATLICERSMCELPFRPRTVTCPTSELVVGKELDAQVSVPSVKLPEVVQPPSLQGPLLVPVRPFCSHCSIHSTWSGCRSFGRGFSTPTLYTEKTHPHTSCRLQRGHI
jgi:Uracil phosphoribosyltransferase